MRFEFTSVNPNLITSLRHTGADSYPWADARCDVEEEGMTNSVITFRETKHRDVFIVSVSWNVHPDTARAIKAQLRSIGSVNHIKAGLFVEHDLTVWRFFATNAFQVKTIQPGSWSYELKNQIAGIIARTLANSTEATICEESYSTWGADHPALSSLR